MRDRIFYRNLMFTTIKRNKFGYLIEIRDFSDNEIIGYEARTKGSLLDNLLFPEPMRGDMVTNGWVDLKEAESAFNRLETRE